MQNILNLHEATTPKYPQIFTNLVYAFKDGQALTLNLIVPPVRPGTKPHFPLLIYVPDITDDNSVKRDERLSQMFSFARYGYAVALLSYRSKSDVSLMVKDINSAVRFLLSKTYKYHFDPYRYVLFGEGLGAYLSALCLLKQRDQALHDEDIHRSPLRYQCCLMLSAPDFFVPLPASYKRYQKTAPTLLEVLQKVSGKLPPVLLLNGTKEPFLPPKEATMLLNAFINAQSNAQLYNFTDAPRGSDAFFTPYSIDLMIDFIDNSLKKKG